MAGKCSVTAVIHTGGAGGVHHTAGPGIIQ